MIQENNIDDGTGAGKSRQVAGVILDNWLNGRTKAVWLMQFVIGKPKQIVSLKKFKLGSKINMANGITYNTLSVKARGTKQSRLVQLVEWLGLDFDEIIAFDESHAKANSIETVTKNGKKAPSLRGLKSMELQNILPNARILYVSATGASEINNLALRVILPLDKASFLSSLAKAGVAGLEVISRDMKALRMFNTVP